MSGKLRSGKNARVKVNSVILNAAEFETEERGDDQEATTFEDNGLETGLIGVLVVEYSFGGDWDAGDNQKDDPGGVYPRDDLANVSLYENVADNVFWFFTRSRVLSSRNGALVRDKVKFSASSVKSHGIYSRPSGSI